MEECHNEHFPISMHPMWAAGDTDPQEEEEEKKHGIKKITHGYFLKVCAKLLIALQVAD